jgi:hypothetical protein
MQLYINENRGQFVSHREEIVDERGTQREREEFVNPRPRGAHHKHLTNDCAARHDRAERCGPRAGGARRQARPSGLEDLGRDAV